jgi:hypothetical protein
VIEAPAPSEESDDEWAASRRLRLLRRRRVIAALALLGVGILFVLGLIEHFDSRASGHAGATAAPHRSGSPSAHQGPTEASSS